MFHLFPFIYIGFHRTNTKFKRQGKYFGAEMV
jgi:hypothetical protein